VNRLVGPALVQGKKTILECASDESSCESTAFFEQSKAKNLMRKEAVHWGALGSDRKQHDGRTYVAQFWGVRTVLRNLQLTNRGVSAIFASLSTAQLTNEGI
jgi:hypothetical protein